VGQETDGAGSAGLQDESKAKSNLAKHGVSFEEASTDKAAEPEMRGEYDFARGVRGKYARR
jgi:hypothetical protein